MCVVIDLDVVCLICLQPNKDMHPIFSTESDSSELQIAQKIAILSELKVDQHNRTLPSKICQKCLQDLKAAWRFRKNCQAAVTIFQTIVKLAPNIQPSEDEGEEQEEIATKDLEEQQIKVPQGLQIKRIHKETTKEESAKREESLIDKNVVEQEEFILNDEKIGSTLYEELVPNDLIENHQNETNEFHSLEEALERPDEIQEIEQEEEANNVTNEEEECTFVEYYITDEVLPNEVIVKQDNKMGNLQSVRAQMTNEIKQTKEPEVRPIKLTEHFRKPIQTRGRAKQQTVLNNSLAKNSKVLQTNSVETIVNNNSSTEQNSNKPSYTQVRPVKTRKRKSLSPDTKAPKICELCGNSYRFQHALNAHMRRHYNEKPFPCDFCDKAFVSNVELKRHMRVHTGQKPYACQYCERRFSDFGSRIKHERTHTGERPYHCPTCGKSFAYPHVLSIHLRTHTGEKKFRCQYCSKGFTKKKYLISHVEQHHVGSNYQVILENSMESSQNQLESNQVKSQQNFGECIYTTEYVNDEDIDGEEEDIEGEEGSQESLVQPKMEEQESEEEIQELVEAQPEEYTITLR